LAAVNRYHKVVCSVDIANRHRIKTYSIHRRVVIRISDSCLERRNSPNLSAISPNSVAFGADHVKVVEDTALLSTL